MSTEDYKVLARAYLLELSDKQIAIVRKVVSAGGMVDTSHKKQLPSLAMMADADNMLPNSFVSCAADIIGAKYTPANHVDELINLCEAGQFADALAMLDKVGGAFISMIYGLEKSREIAAVFPEKYRQEHLTLELLDTVNTIKGGNLAYADTLASNLVSKYKIPSIDQPQHRTDTSLLCVLFMKAVYEDTPITEDALNNLFDALSHLPQEASLLRGLLYNVGLDVFMRQSKIAMAEETALRALHHYRRAQVPGLCFYISLYLAVISLEQGAIDDARSHLKVADKDLSEFKGATKNDVLLLTSFDLIQRYEAGEAQPLIEHLMSEVEDIPFGELWPAMARPIMSYARRALATHVTPAAALSWVRRWRLQQKRSLRFDAIISIQEALALQQVLRWQEADEVLLRISGDDADYKLAHYTSALERVPKSEELSVQLKSFFSMSHLSPRQKALTALLIAQSSAFRGMEREAIRFLGEMISEIRRHNLRNFLAEQSYGLQVVLGHIKVRQLLKRYPHLRKALTSVPVTSKTAQPKILTRQEHRVLVLLAENLSNKLIAQRLGVTLPTVKFHVSNLMRKTGQRNRQSVVAYSFDNNWLET